MCVWRSRDTRFSADWALCAAALFLTAAGADAGIFGGAAANVLILLDNSGSMNDTISVLNPYSNSTNYDTAGNYSSFSRATVYQQTGSGTTPTNFIVYASNVSGVSNAAAQTALNTSGWWYGTVNGAPTTLFLGNYLNYENCTMTGAPCIVGQSKISVARRLLNNLVGNNTNVRWGLATFSQQASQTQTPSVGAQIWAPVGSSTAAIVGMINGMQANTWTPTGEAMRDLGNYFQGTFNNSSTSSGNQYANQTLPTPILTQCEVNVIIVVTDGMWNGQIDPASVAGSLYSGFNMTINGVPNSHSNIITNTVGFALGNDTAQATPSLQAMAANGGGTFYLAANTPQMEQALSGVPPFINLTAPGNFAIVSGTAVPVAATVSNNQCISGLDFASDGNVFGFRVTQPPFSEGWNSTLVANGTHTVYAVAYDLLGSSATSSAVVVLTNNQPPTISNLTFTVGQTTATITWQTDQLSDTQVAYGTSTSYGSTTTLDSTPRTFHSVSLSGLLPGTQYNFKALSKAAGITAQGIGAFTTQNTVQIGPLDHFKLSFLNGSIYQSGPGTAAGGHPYTFSVGSCFSTTIEGLDASGQHSNFSGNLTLSQSFISAAGVETGPAVGITLKNNFQLGISSLSVVMTNGFAFLGSQTDSTQQLCFYRATRSPGDSKNAGDLGDMQLRVIETGTPSVTGISASYVGWHGSASAVVLLGPGESLAAATPTGRSGTLIDQNEGIPFFVRATLTDQYSNAILNSKDTLTFSSALSTATAFNPVQGTVNGSGVTGSSTTILSCSRTVALTAQDLTSTIVTSGQVNINLTACGTVGPTLQKGFLTLAVPGVTTATSLFSTTVTVQNVNIPAGSGNVRYTATLAPLIPTDATHFAPSTGSLSVPAIQFFVPETTSGTYTFNIFNQSYHTAGTFYVQLIASDPPELAGASAIAGPMLVLPGPAAQITATVPAGTVGPQIPTVITVAVTDVYGNGIPNADVTVQVTQGAGSLQSGGLPTSIIQARTDSSGHVLVPFLSGSTSETNQVTAWAPSLPNIPPTQVNLLTSLLGDKIVAAYPSPVKISQRPLTIEYKLDQNSDVKVHILDLFGRQVMERFISAGTAGGLGGFNRITWDGTNGSGQRVAVGVYAVQIDITGNGQTKHASYRFGVTK